MNAGLAIKQQNKDDLKTRFWNNIHFGKVVVCCEPDDHSFFLSVHSAKRPFSYLSFSTNHPGAKSVVRHGLNEFRPQTAVTILAFSLSVSSSMHVAIDKLLPQEKERKIDQTILQKLINFILFLKNAL